MNVLVTGGASGLGGAITSRLATVKEDTVFFSFHESVDKARKIESLYPNCKGIKCDFKNSLDIESVMKLIEDVDIDVLINNAFATRITRQHFHKTDVSVFTDNFHFNVIPVIRITQRAILHFRKKKFGKIISVISSAIVGNPPIGWSEYIAEKSYLAALSKSWAAENISFNITSNTVSPSFMQTDLTRDTDERIIEEMRESHPLKRLLTTDEVADTVLFLSRCSQQINGINLIMNAGVHVV